jgi:hypothetical protein
MKMTWTNMTKPSTILNQPTLTRKDKLWNRCAEIEIACYHITKHTHHIQQLQNIGWWWWKIIEDKSININGTKCNLNWVFFFYNRRELWVVMTTRSRLVVFNLAFSCVVFWTKKKVKLAHSKTNTANLHSDCLCPTTPIFSCRQLLWVWWQPVEETISKSTCAYWGYTCRFFSCSLAMKTNFLW